MPATVTVYCDCCGGDDGSDSDYNVGESILLPPGWTEDDGDGDVLCPTCAEERRTGDED